MSTPSNGNGHGIRVWVPWTLLIAGAVALIAMYQDVGALKKDIDTRAPREVVETQNREVLRALEALRQDMQEMRRLLARP